MINTYYHLLAIVNTKAMNMNRYLNTVIEYFGCMSRNGVLLRLSIAVKRYHKHGNSYKGKH